MTIDEIKNLGTLARLSLTDDEALNFTKEINDILAYVGKVSEIAGTGELLKETGVRFNVMRPDEITVEPGSYTEDILASAPIRSGQYIEVKKIISQD